MSEELEQKYPGVELAYSFAVNSYELAQKRLDIVDARLQTVIGLGATISLPAVVFVNAKGASLTSWWFIGAAIAFACAGIVGTLARIIGNIVVIRPTHLYKHWLHLAEWDFKKDMIYFAGQHFEKNRALARNRGICTTLTFLLFLTEGVLLVAWAASLHHP